MEDASRGLHLPGLPLVFGQAEKSKEGRKNHQDGLAVNQFAMWLTPDEVERLTGRRQPAAQRRWLIARGIPFIESGAGAPLIARGSLLSPPSLEAAREHRPRLHLVK